MTGKKVMSGQTARDRELHRLKAQLSARERQFAIALKALKKIVEFESAHLSVFETEVHYLQDMARRALMEMHALQMGKGLKLPIGTSRQLKVWRKLINPPEPRFAPLYGLLSEEE